MLFLNYSVIWNFSYFFILIYFTILFSLVLYLLPILLGSSTISTLVKVKNNFYLLSGSEMFYFFLALFILYFYINLIWSSPVITSWFGHLIYSSYQFKIFYLILFFSFLFSVFFLSVSYFSSNEIYDFLITKINILYWTFFLFCANSLFTIIFIIEVISTLIFLLLTTSTFSTVFFYKNINFDSKNFFQNSTPYIFLQSILFYFWVTLISSLNLFIFLIYFYSCFLTMDFFLLESIFNYLVLVTSFNDIYSLGVSWFFIIFSIFLKCGIAPMFIWKPTFFKGLSFITISFYITFVYFTLFLFFINFLGTYFHELFFYYSFINLILVISGLFVLFFILCESFYFKTFLAISSILNSILVFISLTLVHISDLFFFL